MKTFFAVLKNNYLRTVPRIVPVIIFTIVTLASIVFSVYITGAQQVKAHIVIVSQDASESTVHSTNALSVRVLPEKPPRSALVEQKYDAYVTVDADGSYQIETLRSGDFKAMLLLLLQNPDADLSAYQTSRGVGVNIIGFMTMFLLMISFSNLFAFADDKEQGQLRRIAATPASFGWYLAAHCFYCLTFFVPEYLLLAVLKLCGWDIGFSLLQYLGLITVLAFLGISFALLLHTLIKKPDNANMLGNSITVLTSILAGSFYSFSRNNAILNDIVRILPQKQLLDFAEHLQSGCASEHAWTIVYVLAFSLCLFAFSCIILQRMYVKSTSIQLVKHRKLEYNG